MKSPQFVRLAVVTKAEAKMLQELLLKADIPSELHSTVPANASVKTVLGGAFYELRVPKSLYGQALELYLQ